MLARDRNPRLQGGNLVLYRRISRCVHPSLGRIARENAKNMDKRLLMCSIGARGGLSSDVGRDA
jgi:hypothetical protein